MVLGSRRGKGVEGACGTGDFLVLDVAGVGLAAVLRDVGVRAEEGDGAGADVDGEEAQARERAREGRDRVARAAADLEQHGCVGEVRCEVVAQVLAVARAREVALAPLRVEALPVAPVLPLVPRHPKVVHVL